MKKQNRSSSESDLNGHGHVRRHYHHLHHLSRHALSSPEASEADKDQEEAMADGGGDGGGNRRVEPRDYEQQHHKEDAKTKRPRGINRISREFFFIANFGQTCLFQEVSDNLYS